MTTKAPAAVKESAADSSEKIAYNAVQSIPTEEPNDRNRLGYHVWRWLGDRQGSLEHVVVESGARITISVPEAVAKIKAELQKLGVKL